MRFIFQEECVKLVGRLYLGECLVLLETCIEANHNMRNSLAAYICLPTQNFLTFF